jgi:hypothetical protein
MTETDSSEHVRDTPAHPPIQSPDLFHVVDDPKTRYPASLHAGIDLNTDDFTIDME